MTTGLAQESDFIDKVVIWLVTDMLLVFNMIACLFNYLKPLVAGCIVSKEAGVDG